MDRELQELDRERQQLERSVEKAGLEVAQRRKKVLDGSLIRQQLDQFERLVGILPLADQKELFSLLIKEVCVARSIQGMRRETGVAGPWWRRCVDGCTRWT